MGVVARVKLAQRVAVARARNTTWATISTDEGMPVRTLQHIHAAYMSDRETLGDPLGVFDETLAIFNATLDQLSDTAANADGTNGEVGALRLMLEVARARVELMVALGHAPRNPSRFRDEQDLLSVVHRMIDVIQRHDLDDRVVAELSEVIESLSTRSLVQHAPGQ